VGFGATDICGICGEPIDLGFQWAARYESRAGADPAGAVESTYGATMKAHTACISANRAVYARRDPLEDAGT
jgi:hypothetical protein